MAMINPAYPSELIRETIEGIREETGQKLPIREVAEGLGVSRKTLDAILNGRQSVTPASLTPGKGIPKYRRHFLATSAGKL